MRPSPYKTARIAELVAQSCRVLGALDMTHNALGHVSYRIGDDHMLIKGKGEQEEPLRYTQPKDIIEINFDTETIDGPDGLRAPSECYIHIGIYKRHPEVMSVIHCHPKHAIVLSACDLEIQPIYGQGRPGALLAIEGVPTYQRSHRITDLETANTFVDLMGSSKVALMRGHGISAYGSSVHDATVRALAFNELLTVNYDAYLVGTPKPIPIEDYEDLKPKQRPLGSLGGESAMLGEWRYYCRLAGEEPILP
jgi:ribulose-5-phosphate 4-epimerase/fuculose-1-phosphate aldolase